MDYKDKQAFLTLIFERTKEGTLGWYKTDKDLRCEAAGVLFILSKEKGDGAYDWVGALKVFDGSALIFSEASNTSSNVFAINVQAEACAARRGLSRLSKVISHLRKEVPMVVSGLEVTREE